MIKKWKYDFWKKLSCDVKLYSVACFHKHNVVNYAGLPWLVFPSEDFMML